ncbi:hypothetical protein F5Y15DRAFT_35455 [Xylariaceae sp. FL0016]|nr:hypothetical protein F5Y15DRAFT_35455 [Xylariaceae sp. FL0016]
MTSKQGGPIGQALVDFSLHGTFPDEDLSSKKLTVDDLAPALTSLSAAKSQLETNIHKINEETAPDVNQWVTNAKSLQDDINKTRSWANEIVRRSEAPDISGRTIEEAEEKVDFLRRETAYNKQVHGALKSIKHVNELLDQVELARDERRILDSLYLLENSWATLDGIPASKSCRVMKLLDMRAFELKSAVHEVFDHVWDSLVHVNVEEGRVAIHDSLEDEPMNLSNAVAGLKAYKEVDQRMALFWHSLDEALVGPRTNLQTISLPGINSVDSSVRLSGQSDTTVGSLFSDLEKIMTFLSERLPEELLHSLSNVMMPDLMPRITSVWLDSAVPSSLDQMDDFQQTVEATRKFCGVLARLKFSGFDDLQEWVDNVPKVWLSKRRETALDTVRSNFTQGLGEPKEIERAETQTVSKSEGQQLAANGTAPVADDDDWGAAWDDGEPAANGDEPASTTNEDDGTDAWGWGDDDNDAKAQLARESEKKAPEADEDDVADAWGWGDEDAADAAPRQIATQQPKAATPRAQTREVTLKETYNISSMPDPVLALISIILEDGASLIANDTNPMTKAAAGLFSLPTLVLAMFRAVSPYYYSLDNGGNMFLYNDATYLSERLSDLATTWKDRDDLLPRAKAMLRLDNDVKTLQSFAARAYASEMSTQRTIIRDLFGGSQNLLQQDGLDSSTLEAQVDGATGHIRGVAVTWSRILSKSAWSQAVGSLVDTVASKLVADVMDLAGIGQDEAYNIANLIARITALDDLFLPEDAGKDAIPATAEYAASWLRMKYLSEVLQSNLQDVKFLWMDSELSLYFTVDEVIDLIGLSFVDNARTREVVRDIQGKPHPLGQ